MTRSLIAENSPYFLSGVKLTYKPSDKWRITGLIVNGWQRIQLLEGNSLPSFGTQINFTPGEKLIFNWSTFIGTDDPDISRRMRYFNNFYGQILVTKKLGLVAGFDIGFQQIAKKSSLYDLWYSPVIIGQLVVNESWSTAIRIEYYQDEKGIIIPKITPNGFKTTGFSLNIDYKPTQDIMGRLEVRWLKSKEPIFNNYNTFTDNNFIIGTSLAIRFNEPI